LYKYKNIIPGLILTSTAAFLSIYFSKFISLGSIAIAILLGFIINSLFSNKLKLFDEGISFSEKTVLSAAIILLGAHLDVKILSFLSFYNVLFIILVIILSIVVCFLIGRAFGVSKDLSILLGIGNAICGSSAIAGSSKILNAKKEEIGISIAIINGLGAICILILPLFLLNIFPNFTNQQYGLIIGSTVQAFGQVTATGFLINQEVGEFATIIKMIRILMLGPFLILLNFILAKNNHNKKSTMLYIPKFIIGFILLSFLVSFNIIPEQFLIVIKKISKILLTIAMAGIGLKISFISIFRFGLKPFLIALFSFILQICFVIVGSLFF